MNSDEHQLLANVFGERKTPPEPEVEVERRPNVVPREGTNSERMRDPDADVKRFVGMLMHGHYDG